MRLKIRVVSLILLVLSAMFGNSISHAAVQLPEKVKIGLFFESTAVSVLNVSSVKGLQLGYSKDNTFNVLYEENSSNTVLVRKDAYYSRNGSTFAELNSSSLTGVSGELLGPYHIQIGSTYADRSAANLKVQEVKQKGIPAYPVFVDTWQVWSGFYSDQNAAQADITANLSAKLGEGEYKVVQPSTNRIVAAAGNGETILIFGSDSGLFGIKPKAENNPYVLKVNNKNYRGELEIRRFSGSDMTMINVLPLEQYLYGVVPAEIESYSHEEALKAQAVAARTYTLSSMGKYRKYDFNLCTTTSSQVYKGFDSEAQSTSKAVDDTKGKIVTYNSKPAQVYYFAASGGRTEDVKNVWGSDVPYLKGVEDKYEKKNREWEVTLTAAKIKEIMLSRNYDLGDILSMAVTKTAESGRVTELVIKGTKSERVYKLQECRTVFSLNSQWYSITTDAGVYIGQKEANAAKMPVAGKKVMTASGMKTLSSSNNVTLIGSGSQKKSVPIVSTAYKLNGKGWGHGLGLSQEGAKGMAGAGFKYDQILMHYFQGTKVE